MEGLLSWGGRCGGLISGIRKLFQNYLIKNKLHVRLTKRVIKMHFPFNGL